MKKIISLLLCVVIVLGMFATVNAASSFSNAKKYNLGSSQKGKLVEDGGSDVYKFVLDAPGSVELSTEADFEYIYAVVFDSNGNDIWSHCEHWNSTLEMAKFDRKIELAKGTYYISFEGIHPGFSGRWYGNYNFTLNYTDAKESFPDEIDGSNNTIKNSSPISLDTKYIGQMAINDKKDIFAFELPSSGSIDYIISGNFEYLYGCIYDSNGDKIWDHCEHWNETMNVLNYTARIELIKGKYYVSFEGIHPGFSGSWYGNYDFQLNFETSNETFDESLQKSNNDVKTADAVNINKIYNGQMASNDHKDIYKFDLSYDKKVELNVKGNMEYLYFSIFDVSGKKVWDHCEHWNGTINELNYTSNVDLKAGGYYISFEGIHPGFSGRWYGDYSFYISDGGAVTDISSPNPAPARRITIVVNDRLLLCDQDPVIENGRTLVPLRAIFEALGAKVDWNNSTQTVVATKGGTQISLQIGSTQMYVNGSTKTLDVPAKLINSRTLVPVRAVSEAFGCKVDWVQDTQTVVITQ